MNEPPLPNPASLVDLSDLLVSTVDAVIHSQEKLDAYNQHQQEIFDATPEGELAVPPLWFAVTNVAIELELSASVSQQRVSDDQGDEQLQTRLICKTLNPLAVGLFGYQASAGLRVRMQLSPGGVVPIKTNR
jgi:hypothetical protein